MRQDKIFARILVLFSVGNVALAGTAVVRQRHLDVAKAASEKRADELPPAQAPVDSARLPPHMNMWWELNGDHSAPPSPGAPPESSTAAANRIIATEGSPTSPPPPHQNFPPQPPHQNFQNFPPQATAPQADRFFSNELKLKISKGLYVTGVLGSTAAILYGLAEMFKPKKYVSPLSCRHLTESQTSWLMMYLR
jgi:hypothetical protein